MQILKSTPKQDGFYMPGEFEPHVGCWILWPERKDTWRSNAKPAQKVFAEVAIKISKFEQVTVGVVNKEYLNARKMLPDNIRVVEISYNDAWLRDNGPLFLKNNRGEKRGVVWNFNAWGGIDSGLYYPWDQDSLVAEKILSIEKIDYYKPGIILEGGSIHVDGEGTLITTEECLLNKNRNPNLSKDEIEEILCEYLNIEKIIWLKRGVYNDETDGHVDNLCCFIKPRIILLTWTDDKNDPQYEISLNAFERLSRETDAKGRKFEIHKILQPKPLYLSKEEASGLTFGETSKSRLPGNRLPASYINFYISNKGIIMPKFNDHYDNLAERKLKELLPKYKIYQIYTREILLGGGNIHCIIQQIPF